MPTPTDVARALTELAERRAKDLDDAPTGVTPGYSAALGGTVLPNGKLRYVSAAPSFMVCDALYRVGTTQTIEDGNTEIINYNTLIYDPDSRVTTGAAWAYTAARAGILTVVAQVYAINNTTFDTGPGPTLILWLYVNGAQAAALHLVEIGTDLLDENRFLHGVGSVLVAANDTVNVRLMNTSGADVDANTTAASNRIAIYV